MEYNVPEKLAIFMDKMQAAEDLRDRCINSPFGFRRARKCAADKHYFQRKFWGGIYEIYPGLKDKTLSYNFLKQTIILMAPDDNINPKDK